METTQTNEIEECQNDEHEWEWRAWSTLAYVQGYWVCKKCGKMKLETERWNDFDNNYTIV